MDRRTLLRRSVAVAIAGLAGCAGEPEEPTATSQPTDPVETTAATTTEPAGTPTRTASPTSTETDAATDSPAGTDSPTGTTTTTASATPSPTATPAEADQVVVVGADSSLRFEPNSFTVEADATVLWRWDAGGHNVRPGSIPEDASWTGTPGSDGDTYSSGYTYSHTFDVAGEYEYYCGPHRSAGMTGSFTVE